MRIWVLQRYQSYARVCLTTALFIAPVVFHRDTVDVFNLVKLTALWLLGVSAFALWLAWSLERGVWFPRIRIGYAVAAFIFVCILATAFSENPSLSLVGLYHRYGGLLPFMLYAGILVMIVGLYWERPGDLKEVARAGAAAAFLMTAYALIQAAKLDFIEWRDPSTGQLPGSPVSTMGNSNFAGGYLGIAAPLCFYVALSARRNMWRTILLAACGLELLALWYTSSRGGMIAGGAGLVALAFLYWSRIPRWVRSLVIVGIVVAILVSVVVIFHPGMEETPEPLAQIKQFSTATFTVRVYYWTAAVRIFLDHPILGTGLDTYYANYPKYRLAADGASSGLTLTDKPHNIYLEYAANAGILGLGSYLVMVGLGIWYGVRSIRRLEGPAKFLLATFLSMLAGYLAQGFFSIDVPPLAMMGWVALGGVATIGDPGVLDARERIKRSLAEERRNPPGKRRSKRREPEIEVSVRRRNPVAWPVYAGIGLGAAGLLFLGTRPVAADVQGKNAQVRQVDKKSPDQILQKWEHAIRLYPFEPTYRTQAGAISEQKAANATDAGQRKTLLSIALARYEEALRLQPGNVFYLMNVARVHTTWAETVDPSRFDEAGKWWQRAVDRDPTDWDVRNRYALMLNSWANATGGDVAIRRRTIEQLALVTRMRPEFAPAWINLGKVNLVLGQVDQAEVALRKALDLEPENEEVKVLIARIQARSF